jgi:hypothetical protein
VTLVVADFVVTAAAPVEFLVTPAPVDAPLFAGPPSEAPATRPLAAPPTAAFGPFLGPPTCAKAGAPASASEIANPIATNFMSVAPFSRRLRRIDLSDQTSFPQAADARKRKAAHRRRSIREIARAAGASWFFGLMVILNMLEFADEHGNRFTCSSARCCGMTSPSGGWNVDFS